MFSITGLASGLDTDTMISQLMKAERQPVSRLEQQQSRLRRVDDAWGEVTRRLSALRSAITAVGKGVSFAERWKAASSDDAVAGASVTGTPSPGSTTFSVAQLAQAQSSHNDTGLAGADELVGAGTFTLKAPDGSVLASVTTDATTTLADLAAEVDDLTGFRAAVVKKADGDHRLTIGAMETGLDNAFTVETDLASLGAFANGVDARDAELTVGGLAVTRSSNTVSDLIEGVTLDLKTTGTATVTTSQDVDGAVADVKKLVGEVNATLAKLKELTAYDPETKKSGPLQGDATSHRLVDQLRRGVMDVVGGIAGSTTTAGSVGISMNRDGGFTIDETRLKAALTDDPGAVDRLFARSGTSDLAGVTYRSSSKATQVGTHEVTVDQAATVARLAGVTLATPPPNATYTITGKDGRTVTVSVSDAASIGEAVAQINQQILDAVDGPTTVEAREEGGTIVLEETRYGSARGFTVTSDDDVYGLAGTSEGLDAQVSIGGETFTGRGREVAVDSGPADGLRLTVDGATPGDVATVTVGEGISGRLDRILANTYEGRTGAIQSARNSITTRIDLYQDRIDAFEVRLAQREETIRRQFTGMESALARLQEQGSWLAGQLAAFTRPLD